MPASGLFKIRIPFFPNRELKSAEKKALMERKYYLTEQNFSGYFPAYLFSMKQKNKSNSKI